MFQSQRNGTECWMWGLVFGQSKAWIFGDCFGQSEVGNYRTVLGQSGTKFGTVF